METPVTAAALNEFLSTLTPLRAAKARGALEKQVRVNGREFMFRHVLVEQCVSQGYHVTLRKNGERVLMSADQTFYDTQNITATGLDYAVYLIDRK